MKIKAHVSVCINFFLVELIFLATVVQYFYFYVYFIKILQLECISDHTDFSLQVPAILLINEIHEITFLTVNGISCTLLMESTTNLVFVVLSYKK